MPISNLSQTPATFQPPQITQRPDNTNNNLLAIKPTPAGNLPVAKDTVTISRAAASLNAAADNQRNVAAVSIPDTARRTENAAASQTNRAVAEQNAAVENQKSTADSTQVPRGTMRISKMI